MSKYGYDDASLNSIIVATSGALDQMGRVNQQVYAISGQLPAANNSTSGQKLSMALANWNSDFTRVVGQLNALNEKANALLRANRSANTDADGASGGAQ
ncbi:hypothetical protein [Actinokineospora sp. NPDC004072]